MRGETLGNHSPDDKKRGPIPVADYSDEATHQMEVGDLWRGESPSNAAAVVDLTAAKRRVSIVPGYDPLDHISTALDEAHPAIDDYAGPDNFATFDWEAGTGEVTGPMEIAALQSPGTAAARPLFAAELDDSHVVTTELPSPQPPTPPPAQRPVAHRGRPPARPRQPSPPQVDHSVTGESSRVFIADEWEQEALGRPVWPYLLGGALVVAAVAALCVAIFLANVDLLG